MKIDGFEIPASAAIQGLAPEVSMLPVTAKAGNFVYLTQQEEAHEPGLYAFLEEWGPVGTITSVEVSEGLTGGGNAGKITISLDSTVAKKSDLINLLTAESLAPYVKASELPTVVTPYDVGTYIKGKPSAGTALMIFESARSFSLPVNLAGSVASAEIQATAAATFTILVNDVQVGSFTFAAGSSVATFTAAAKVSLNSGDILIIKAPSTSDDTLSGLRFTLAGTV